MQTSPGARFWQFCRILRQKIVDGEKQMCDIMFPMSHTLDDKNNEIGLYVTHFGNKTGFIRGERTARIDQVMYPFIHSFVDFL